MKNLLSILSAALLLILTACNNTNPQTATTAPPSQLEVLQKTISRIDALDIEDIKLLFEKHYEDSASTAYLTGKLSQALNNPAWQNINQFKDIAWLRRCMMENEAIFKESITQIDAYLTDAQLSWNWDNLNEGQEMELFIAMDDFSPTWNKDLLQKFRNKYCAKITAAKDKEQLPHQLSIRALWPDGVATAEDCKPLNEAMKHAKKFYEPFNKKIRSMNNIDALEDYAASLDIASCDCEPDLYMVDVRQTYIDKVTALVAYINSHPQKYSYQFLESHNGKAYSSCDVVIGQTPEYEKILADKAKTKTL